MTRRLIAVALVAVAATGCDHPAHLDPTLVCLRRHESDRPPQCDGQLTFEVSA